MNLADYALRHTTFSASVHNPEDTGRCGPFFVSLLDGCRKDVFLELLLSPGATRADVLDGEEHSLWDLGYTHHSSALTHESLAIMGMGVVLGIFDLVSPWDARVGLTVDDVSERLFKSDPTLDIRFRARRAAA